MENPVLINAGKIHTMPNKNNAIKKIVLALTDKTKSAEISVRYGSGSEGEPNIKLPTKLGYAHADISPKGELDITITNHGPAAINASWAK